MEHEIDCGIICSWCTRNSLQRLGKWTGRIGNRRASQDHPDNSIAKIGQNTEKSPVDLKRLVVS